MGSLTSVIAGFNCASKFKAQRSFHTWYMYSTCSSTAHSLSLTHVFLPPFFPRPSSSVAEILLVVIQSKNVMHNKKTTCEECKSAYAKQLESTNALQREHYTQNIPSVFQALQVGWDRCRLINRFIWRLVVSCSGPTSETYVQW